MQIIKEPVLHPRSDFHKAAEFIGVNDSIAFFIFWRDRGQGPHMTEYHILLHLRNLEIYLGIPHRRSGMGEAMEIFAGLLRMGMPVIKK